MRRPLLPVLLLVLLIPSFSNAQWQPDGAPISTALLDQSNAVLIPDGQGGAIIAWQDARVVGLPNDIYVQRIDAFGAPQWALNGVIVCNAGGDQTGPTIIADGSGGAIIAWNDPRNGTSNTDIFAQRVNSAGVMQWTSNGVAVCTATGGQFYPRIVSDGGTGWIMTWMDGRVAASDIYAQRLNASGVPQWTANGVVICAATNTQQISRLVPDTAGGAIIAWEDLRGGTTLDIYAQRVNGSGVVQWTADGVVVCNAVQTQTAIAMLPDGAGGALLAWQDFRGGTSYDVLAQRINAAGVPLWPANGTAVCQAAGHQQVISALSDDAGGMILTWQDFRSGGADIYAQRMSSTGAPQWAMDGVVICNNSAGNQLNPSMASDGAGGAVIAWEDARTGGYDVYAQRVTGAGNVQWTANGVVLSQAANTQGGTQAIADGAGGVVVCWYDLRPGISDVYAQRVDVVYGTWGHPEPVLKTVADVNHDQGGKVAVNWTASGRDIPVPATIDYYSIWRATTVAPFGVSSNDDADFIAPEDVRPDTPAGKRTKIQMSSYYWELVGTQTAFRQPAYSYAASTRSDSVAASAGTTFFMVMAHDRVDGHIAYTSNVLSGHSVDNLAPAPPLFLSAQRAGSNVNLKWNRVRVPDLRDYTVYRKTSSGVTAIPANFLSDAVDTVLTDASAPAGALYYIVTAYDVHDNQSAPSNEAAVGASTGVGGNLPPITGLMVQQNRPNPFTATSIFDLGLPSASKVSLEVFDVAGRRVASRFLGSKPAGWQSISIDVTGDDGKPLASGVYFYRVTAAGQTQTRKMVIAR